MPLNETCKMDKPYIETVRGQKEPWATLLQPVLGSAQPGQSLGNGWQITPILLVNGRRASKQTNRMTDQINLFSS